VAANRCIDGYSERGGGPFKVLQLEEMVAAIVIVAVVVVAGDAVAFGEQEVAQSSVRSRVIPEPKAGKRFGVFFFPFGARWK